MRRGQCVVLRNQNRRAGFTGAVVQLGNGGPWIGLRIDNHAADQILRLDVFLLRPNWRGQHHEADQQDQVANESKEIQIDRPPELDQIIGLLCFMCVTFSVVGFSTT